jgi:hypothetical protein
MTEHRRIQPPTPNPGRHIVSVICITNSVEDLRSCVRRDAHNDDCNGFEYVWVEQRGQFEASGRACTGCTPRIAYNGFVCRNCFDRIIAAIAAAPAFLATLRGVDRALTPTSGGGRASVLGYVPLTALALAVDEIERYLDGNPGNAESWVATPEGAQSAVGFANAMHSAIAAHPTRESAHQVRRVRCPKCGQMTLAWHPTPWVGGEVTIRCRNTECGSALSQDDFEALLVGAPAHAEAA